MSKRKQENMLNSDLQIDMVALRNELDGVAQACIPDSTKNQNTEPNNDFQMDVVFDFIKEGHFPVLKIDRNLNPENIAMTDDCSLMQTLSVSDQLVDICENVTSANHVSFCTLTSTESFSTPPSNISQLTIYDPFIVSPLCPITPTSGPTPIATPINSMPNSPSGSLYSGYSSGWGPPSPPSKEPHRKRRLAAKDRVRAVANTPTDTSGFSNITPKTSPKNSVVFTSEFVTLSSQMMEESQEISPPTSDGKNNVPRHKRPSHIRAEHKRRNKIQGGIEELKSLVPAIADVCQNGGKESKSAILAKRILAVEHCRTLRRETKDGARELESLKAELESLTRSILEYQTQLPVNGAEVEQPQSKPVASIQQMFRDYVGSRTLCNWKFWIFSMLITPLFESYISSVDATADRDRFVSTLLAWLDKNCSLVSLRPVVFKALRNLSKNSSIMTNPVKVQEEALNDVFQTNLLLQKETPL